VQIVALGSGLETVWFNLMEEGTIQKKFRFIELDLESVVKKKIKKIIHSKKLASLFKKLNLEPVVSCNHSIIKNINIFSHWATTMLWQPAISQTSMTSKE